MRRDYKYWRARTIVCFCVMVAAYSLILVEKPRLAIMTALGLIALAAFSFAQHCAYQWGTTSPTDDA